MSDAEYVLRAAESILIIDWPSTDVPASLASAGYAVVVKGGPGPDQYTAKEMSAGEVIDRHLGRRPEHADIVYCHRPLAELPDVVALAKDLGAVGVWYQSGLSEAGGKDPKGCWIPDEHAREAREIAESAGLTYIDDVYIADAVRRLDIHR